MHILNTDNNMKYLLPALNNFHILLAVPGDWLEWGPWTTCSITCGGGTRERDRECNMTSYGDLTAACIGDPHEIGNCHTYPCDPLSKNNIKIISNLSRHCDHITYSVIFLIFHFSAFLWWISCNFLIKQKLMPSWRRGRARRGCGHCASAANNQHLPPGSVLIPSMNIAVVGSPEDGHTVVYLLA